MTLRQTLFLVVATLLYLLVELAFSARLLDVVGGAATPEQIHSIEIYGRTLSGIALALVVFQLLLHQRNHGKKWRPSNAAIVLICSISAGILFVSLEALTNYLSNSSSPFFRHASLNIVLIQRALVEDRVRIDGLTDDREIFSRPEGKAFLALFPVMATFVERLEEKIRNAKLDLIRNEVAQRAGGPEGYYKKYADAVQHAGSEWKRYNAAGNRGDDVDIGTRQDKAWNDYLRDLRKRGWTPNTIPDQYRAKVLRKVQSKVPVPSNWDLSDEEVFRAAVARRVEDAKRGRSNSVQYRGKQIPLGLAWPAFFAHPVVQGDLHEKLKLPRRVVLKPAYSSGDDFERTVFDPMVEELARGKIATYDAPVESFADGAKNAAEGREMARAAIVPPLALFFSLLGALGHFSKLCFLSMKAAGQLLAPGSQWVGKVCWIVLALVFIGGWLTLSLLQNDVTQSRLYAYLQQQINQDEHHSTRNAMLSNVLHVVAVGQGVFYPVNEKIRTEVLGGITFGYNPPAKLQPA
jgi:hypothetical protein